MPLTKVAEIRPVRNDAVGQVDLIQIHRHAHGRQRPQHDAKAVVPRLLGLQAIAEPEQLAALGVRRQYHRGAGRTDVRGREELLGQGRRAEAIADRAAQRELRREIVARRQLADFRIAEVAVMLVAAGQVDAQVLDGLAGQIDVDRPRSCDRGCRHQWAPIRRRIGRHRRDRPRERRHRCYRSRGGIRRRTPRSAGRPYRRRSPC